MNKFYLTTPLYYVNSKPHIGHAYTEIACDVLARWHRMTGKNVHFLTGTDEHGQKIAKAADAAGMPPQEFTDKISRTFLDLWTTLDVSHDDFIRTTEERHKKAVSKVWEELKGKKVGGQDVLYRHTYDGWYCVSCETFITEGLLDPTDPSKCPDCKKPLEAMKEETYFFRMSAYQDRLIQDLRSGKLRVLPESRKNEVLGFLEHNKLADLSVSRPKNRLAWGIPIPFDAEHVTYVWFDALINYVSAVGYGSDPAKMKEWWPADVHVIGKDIIRHHAVIWPALLYALNIELPKLVFAHGWWVQGGQKMSKSLGNVTDPNEIVARYGVDTFRYFLLRETAFGQDGTFSEEALTLRYNVDLANNLGNLLSRTLTMCEKYFGGIVPDFPEVDPASAVISDATMLKSRTEVLFSKVDDAMQSLAFHEALSHIWDVIDRSNRFIEASAPWTLAKQKKEEDLKLVIVILMNALRTVAQLLWPFMPRTAESIWSQLGQTAAIRTLEKDPGPLHKTFGAWVSKGAPLFPRIETEK
jgi:methionyl-tRNA synthetase